jgi:hypothetical protein
MVEEAAGRYENMHLVVLRRIDQAVQQPKILIPGKKTGEVALPRSRKALQTRWPDDAAQLMFEIGARAFLVLSRSLGYFAGIAGRVELLDIPVTDPEASGEAARAASGAKIISAISQYFISIIDFHLHSHSFAGLQLIPVARAQLASKYLLLMAKGHLYNFTGLHHLSTNFCKSVCGSKYYGGV